MGIIVAGVDTLLPEKVKKMKVKLALEQTVKAQGRSEGIALVFPLPSVLGGVDGQVTLRPLYL
jgi:hypothetical protein